MFISGEGKEEYLTVTEEPPSKFDPIYKQWKVEVWELHHMIMSWLMTAQHHEPVNRPEMQRIFGLVLMNPTPTLSSYFSLITGNDLACRNLLVGVAK